MSLALLSAPAWGEDAGRVFSDPFRAGEGHGPTMVALPAGAFVMGAEPGDPAYNPKDVPHRVELSGFAIARDETTNAAFVRFLNANDSTPDSVADLVDIAGAPGLRWNSATGAFAARDGHAQRPVTGVSWPGAMAYARWLSRRTGHAYTLPSEAQWEYAASTGGATAANCKGAPGPSRPREARAGAANDHGLRHMVGNVWEWTLDCYQADFYFHAPRRDPRFFDPHCLAPIIRGGSFRDGPAMCSASYRVNYWWRGHLDGIGFRVVRHLSPRRVTSSHRPGDGDG